MFSFLRGPGFHYLLWLARLAGAKTQTTEFERACLRRYAKDRRRLAEIGVWHGVTTRILRSAMAKDGILFAVDPFPLGRFGFSWEHLIARGEVARESNGTVKFLVSTSAQAASRLPEMCMEPLDFVFIDAEHSFEAVQADWNMWTRLLAPGGVVALHDSRSHPGETAEHGGVIRFTRENALRDRRFAIVEFVDSLSVFVRNLVESSTVTETCGIGANAPSPAGLAGQSELINQFQDPLVSRGSSTDIPALLHQPH